jgi:hypothetical protein
MRSLISEAEEGSNRFFTDAFPQPSFHPAASSLSIEVLDAKAWPFQRGDDHGLGGLDEGIWRFLSWLALMPSRN